jgi:hypothetical protein
MAGPDPRQRGFHFSQDLECPPFAQSAIGYRHWCELPAHSPFTFALSKAFQAHRRGMSAAFSSGRPARMMTGQSLGRHTGRFWQWRPDRPARCLPLARDGESLRLAKTGHWVSSFKAAIAAGGSETRFVG